MAYQSTSPALPSLQALSQYHPHHLTAPSPWPLLTAGSTLAMLTGAVLWFNMIADGGWLLCLGLVTTTLAFTLWWRDIVAEGTHLGAHTRVVQSSHGMGVSLFIVTEAFFFISIFWAYLHSSLAPIIEMGSQWPPAGITPLSPVTLPLLNTMLLVSSGATVTWAHHALIRGDRGPALLGMVVTVILASVFTACQMIEYSDASFSMADGAFGTCFYFGTGFHGLHVLIGTLFIAVGLGRLVLYHFTRAHHMGLEASILYWHFVDVVWLALYLIVYWWGSN